MRVDKASIVDLSGIGPLFWVLVLLSVMVLCVALPLTSVGVGISIVIGWSALIWVTNLFLRRSFHYAMLVWVAVYPYCYSLFSYPAERAIFTVDRAFLLLLLVEMILFARHDIAGGSLAYEIQMSGFAWGIYLVVCFASLMGHPTSKVLTGYRLLVDGMLMPAVLGLYAVRCFPLIQDLTKLHMSACILGIGLFTTGLIELITDIDLFPWSGSDPMFTDTHVRRADGPFEQQIILSMVSILAFFFILYLRRIMPPTIPPWRTLLHRAGCVASFGAALLPLNRGLLFALAPIAAIDYYSKHRLVSRRIWAIFFSLIVVAGIAARLADPGLYEDRVANPANFYQRLAQHRETLRVVREYPIFGVGFSLYHDVSTRNPRFMARWKGIESVTVQHNVMMTVLSEQGIVGLMFYLSAQVFFIRAMWKIRGAHPAGWLAFLYCLIIYLLIGFDFATAYYSDINLFYIFVLGVIYQMQSRLAGQGFVAASRPSLTSSVPV